MRQENIHNDSVDARPRVVIVGLASCFGCQLQITNMESHLMDVLSQVDVQYWQLTSSDPMPSDCDVAVIEGAVITEEAEQTLISLRKKASKIIAIGACANTAGIPGMAARDYEQRFDDVYSKPLEACGNPISPRPVSSVISVDYQVPCCPIDPLEFLDVLSGALYGSNKVRSTRTMCGDCKRNESMCFFGSQELCLGLVTVAGCGARCVNLGRPCNGCRGISPDANLESAREAVDRFGMSVEVFDKALEMFNQANPVIEERE